MATSTELLRAAEHMRGMLDGLRPAHKMMALSGIAVLEREAKRLQAIEAEQSKRSWPEGWPPFAVLRRAYESLGVEPRPSTRWVEAHGWASELVHARDIRKKWRSCLSSDPSSP